MPNKMITVLVGLVLALGLSSSAAAYPAGPPDASVSNPVVAPGEAFMFFAEGFGPGTPVTITVTLVDAQAAGSLDVLASGGSRAGAGFVVVRTSAGSSQTYSRVADAQGRISLPLDLSVPGTYAIVASGVDADGRPFSVSSSVLVDADAAGGGSGSGSGDGSNAGSGSNTGTNTGSGSNAGSGTTTTTTTSTTSAGGVLARTGVDDIATVAWAGFGVLVLGGLLVAVASGRGRTRQTV